MSNTNYASAVAAVKAMESSLLTQSELEQLINTSSAQERANLISSKRGTGNETLDLEAAWETVHSYAPESRELEILLYRNDFHNLKAALKAMVADRDPERYYIKPTNIDLPEFTKLIRAKEFDMLPDHLKETAAEAYELLTRTLDGQLADSMIDTASLAAMQKSAAEFGGDFMKRYADLMTVCADIKTAYRCSKMNKPRQFLETAVCGCGEMDKESMIRAALGGTESFLSYLETTAYSEAGKLLSESAAKFEKWSDDRVMELAETARLQAFGSDPLAAYYIAVEAEQKNLRIINICKESGADSETITERMRKLYV